MREVWQMTYRDIDALVSVIQDEIKQREAEQAKARSQARRGR